MRFDRADLLLIRSRVLEVGIVIRITRFHFSKDLSQLRIERMRLFGHRVREVVRFFDKR